MSKQLSDRLVNGFMKHMDKAPEPVDPTEIGAELAIFMSTIMYEFVPKDCFEDVKEGFNAQQQLYAHLRSGGRIS